MDQMRPRTRQPELEFRRNDAGRVVSALVRLRDGKAVGSIQPNDDVPVFFMLDKERQLVGILLHQPVSGVALIDVIYELIEDDSGRPVGVDRRICYGFDTPQARLDFLRGTLRALRKAIAGLTAAATA